jgi:hypothetical protein
LQYRTAGINAQIIGEWTALRLWHAGTASRPPRLIVGYLRVPALDRQLLYPRVLCICNRRCPLTCDI